MYVVLTIPQKNLIKDYLQVLTEGIQFYKIKTRGKKNLGQKSLNKAVDRRVRWWRWSNKQQQGHSDDLSEPDDEMETGSINDNFRNVFYFAARINLDTFLVEQVASVLLS